MGSKEFALINDGIYAEGSMVQGKKIVKIFLDHVDLKDETENQILTLTIQPESKRP